MKKQIRAITISQILVSFLLPRLLHAQIEVAVQDLRGSSPAEEIPTAQGKYVNDNSFVKLYPTGEEIKVANRNVFIRIPQQLNYDELFEALLKVRAALTAGANVISVESAIPFSQVTLTGDLGHRLSLENLFSIAVPRLIVDTDRSF